MLKVVEGQGDDKCEFAIHEALLTARSKFFAKAMGKGWKEAEEKVVNLPDDKQEVFPLYASLVYTGTVPALDEKVVRIHRNGDGQTHCEYPEEYKLEYELLVGLYVLSEKIQDTMAKNTAVEALIAKVTHESKIVNNRDEGPCMPSLPSIETMYTKTPHHCPGRQALIDCFVWYGREESMNGAGLWEGVRPHREFLIDLSRNLMSLRQQPTRELPHERINWYKEPEDEKDEWSTEPWWYVECAGSPLSR